MEHGHRTEYALNAVPRIPTFRFRFQADTKEAKARLRKMHTTELLKRSKAI